MMIKKALFFLFILLLPQLCLAQSTPAKIQRSEELLEKETILRNRIEGNEKIYVKKVILKGATKLGDDEIKDLIASFQKRWLTESDIQLLLESIKQSYEQKNIPTDQLMVDYKFRNGNLVILIEEGLTTY